jgi:outer membrane protein OmpA-like peptidoglycan-associated protein
MIIARVRHTLGAPASTTMSLAGDTLRIGGVVTVDLLRKLHEATANSGVAHVDLSAARVTLSPALEELRRSIESQRVLFDPGSSTVRENDDAALRALVAPMRRLSDSVAVAGASLSIDLIGRTDPTGSDATNQSLAQQRVDAVLRRLTGLGVPTSMLNGRSVATLQPLRGQDTGEQARINRSVSFEVVVANGARASRGQ